MASPLKTGKQSVHLGAPVRGSRIRRDPPPRVVIKNPIAKKISEQAQDEREAWQVVLGVVLFAVAIGIVTVGIFSADGWSPSEYTINISDPQPR
jgi:hypothetical protein